MIGINKLQSRVLAEIKQRADEADLGVNKITKLPNRELHVNLGGDYFNVSEGTKLAGALPIRDANGRFRRASTLKNILQGILLRHVLKGMGKPVEGDGRVAFRNRTGRFASSVNITKFTNMGNNNLSLEFQYMNIPYDAFEDGTRYSDKTDPIFATHLKETYADPTALIDQSIRRSLEDAVAKQYSIRITGR